MKKILCIIMAVVVFSSIISNCYALDTALFDMRNKLFDASKKISKTMQTSKDVVFLTTMFDSCLIATSQLDAYFSMLDIFNSIKKEDVTEVALNAINKWLLEVKASDSLNIKSLDSITTQAIEKTTKDYIGSLKSSFESLNNQIDVEISKIVLLKKASRLPKGKK